jgi:hypothetical protein
MSVKRLLGAVGRAAVLGAMLVVASGCETAESPSAIRRAEASADGLAVTVCVEAVPGPHGPVARCEVCLEVTGDDAIVVFADPSLPSVLCTPDGVADICFGLSAMPEWLDSSEQRLGCMVLPPGLLVRRTVLLWTPLDEVSPYGNPWHRDPRSPHYIPADKRQRESAAFDEERMRIALTWHKIRVRVAYFDYSRDRHVFPKASREDLDRSVPAEAANSVSLMAAQREIAVSFDLSDVGK